MTLTVLSGRKFAASDVPNENHQVSSVRGFRFIYVVETLSESLSEFLFRVFPVSYLLVWVLDSFRKTVSAGTHYLCLVLPFLIPPDPASSRAQLVLSQ